MAYGGDPDEAVDEPAPLAPPRYPQEDGITTGAHLHELAPEIFSIVRRALGWTADQLRNWDHDGTLGTCGEMNVTAGRATIERSIHQLGEVRGSLQRLDLGVHHAFGRLVIDVMNGPEPRTLTDEHRYRALKKLLPDFFALTGSDVGEVHGNDLADEIPPLPVAFGPSPAGILLLRLDQQYHGLFWPENYFSEAVSWAVATVYQHSTFARANMVEGSQVTQAVLEAYVLRGTIELRDIIRQRPAEQHCTDSAFTFRMDRTAVAQWIDETPGLGEKVAYHPEPPDDRHVTLCGSMAVRAAKADFYFFWATYLFDVGKECESPWALMMAALCARLGLTQIVSIGGVLVHEINHHDEFGHCHVHCVQGANDIAFRNSLHALYGLVVGGDDDPDRWAVEEWSATERGGGADCPGNLFEAVHTHCSLLGMGRAHHVRLRYKFDSTVHPPNCFTASSYPWEVQRTVIPDGAESCF